VLKPFVASGEIKLVAEQFSKDWQPAEAMKHAENALTRANNNVQAVVTANDGMAGGVVSALKSQGLAGRVAVSGQDADLAACQRIVEGTQTMTVYKPISKLAAAAAEAAVQLAKNEPARTNAKVENGKRDVPSILLTPVQVDRANMAQTVVKDGFQRLEAVYKNIPKAQWPKARE
jgi:D-xylose transport system substrate-binding protein